VAGLHLAAYFGLTEFVSTVLEQNHDVDMRDTMGNSPLMWATIGNQAAAMILLLERGANGNIKNIFGDTPLINASREGALTAVQLGRGHICE
jgi:ankyrin repeat protein